MPVEEEKDENCMVLPKDSYTAYRLRYGDAEVLNMTSSVVFLGKIPDVWILDKKSRILTNIYKLRTLAKAQNLLAEKKTVQNFESVVHRNSVPVSDSNAHKHLHVSHKGTKKPNKSSTETITDTESSDKNKKHNVKSYLLNPHTQTHNHTADHHQPLPKVIITEKVQLNDIEEIGAIVHNSGSSTKFDIPRRSIEQENMEFCKLFDSSTHYDKPISGQHHEVHDHLQRKDNTPFMKEKTQKELSNSKAKQRYTHKSNTNLNKSLQTFLSKTFDEKQDILKTEINDAMIAIHENNNYDVLNGFDSVTCTETDTCTDSEDIFVTASDQSEEEEDKEKDGVINTLQLSPNVVKTVKTNAKSVSFNSRKTLHIVPQSSHYNLGTSSKRVLLDEQNPIPTKPDSFKYDPSSNLSNIPCPSIDMDDNIIQTFKLFKSKVLTAKVAATTETKIEERKKRLCYILNRFKKGEIIKMEKMLVMSSYSDKMCVKLDYLNDSKTSERWKEYIVVVRATSDLDYPAIIQFYKSNHILKSDGFSSLEVALQQEHIQSEIMKAEHDIANEDLNEILEQEVDESSDDGSDDNDTISSHDFHTIKDMKKGLSDSLRTKIKKINKKEVEKLKRMKKTRFERKGNTSLTSGSNSDYYVKMRVIKFQHFLLYCLDMIPKFSLPTC